MSTARAKREILRLIRGERADVKEAVASLLEMPNDEDIRLDFEEMMTQMEAIYSDVMEMKGGINEENLPTELERLAASMEKLREMGPENLEGFDKASREFSEAVKEAVGDPENDAQRHLIGVSSGIASEAERFVQEINPDFEPEPEPEMEMGDEEKPSIPSMVAEMYEMYNKMEGMMNYEAYGPGMKKAMEMVKGAAREMAEMMTDQDDGGEEIPQEPAPEMPPKEMSHEAMEQDGPSPAAAKKAYKTMTDEPGPGEFRKCIARLSQEPGIDDPAALCMWLKKGGDTGEGDEDYLEPRANGIEPAGNSMEGCENCIKCPNCKKTIDGTGYVKEGYMSCPECSYEINESDMSDEYALGDGPKGDFSQKNMAKGGKAELVKTKSTEGDPDGESDLGVKVDVNKIKESDPYVSQGHSDLVPTSKTGGDPDGQSNLGVKVDVDNIGEMDDEEEELPPEDDEVMDYGEMPQDQEELGQTGYGMGDQDGGMEMAYGEMGDEEPPEEPVGMEPPPEEVPEGEVAPGTRVMLPDGSEGVVLKRMASEENPEKEMYAVEMEDGQAYQVPVEMMTAVPEAGEGEELGLPDPEGGYGESASLKGTFASDDDVSKVLEKLGEMGIQASVDESDSMTVIAYPKSRMEDVAARSVAQDYDSSFEQVS